MFLDFYEFYDFLKFYIYGNLLFLLFYEIFNFFWKKKQLFFLQELLLIENIHKIDYSVKFGLIWLFS